MRAPEDAAVGTGLSGIPVAPYAPWSDVGHAAVAGLHEAGASGAGFLASISRDPELERSLSGTAQEQQQAAEEQRQQMTPTIQGGWGHPLVWGAEQAAPLGAFLGAGALGTAVGGPAGGAAAAAATMGGMTRADVYNRLMSQGIEPTTGQLAEATAIGAAAGVVPELGLSGKIAVGPLVQRALGATEGAITFGGMGAGEEAVSQKAEIAAGKRQDYDVGAIAGAGVGQAEFGAVMGGLHGRGVVEAREPGAKQIDQSHPQTGGEATPVRSDREGRKPDAAPGPGGKPSVTPRVTPEEAPTITEIPDTGYARVEPKATGPAPPADPAADPAVKAAATGEGAKPTGTPPVTPESKAAPAAEPAPAEPAPAKAGPGPELMQQQTEMLDKDHPRDVVHFPPDVEPPILSKQQKLRYGSSKLDDGSTLQYDRSAGSKVNAPKIKDHRNAGTLDQYVEQVKQASEDRIAAKTAPPPPPTTPEAPVTAPPTVEAPERPIPASPAAIPEGEATPLPAREESPPAASLEAPGGIRPEVVEAEAPQPTGVTVPAGVAEEAARAEVTPGVTGRVLEAAPVTEHERALTKEAQLKEKARLKAEAKAAEKAAKAEGDEIVKVGGKNWTKKELARAEENNRKAQEIVERHPRQEGESLVQTHARAKAMVKDAVATGVDIPKEIGKGTLHSPDTMLLAEARALGVKKASDIEAHTRFFDQEHMLRERKMEEAVDVRRAEGAEGLGSRGMEGAEAPKATDVGRSEAEHELSPEEELIRRQEEEAKARPEEEEKPQLGEMKVGAADEAKAAGGKAPAYAAFGERKAPAVVTLKRRGIRKVEGEGEEEPGEKSLYDIMRERERAEDEKRPDILTHYKGDVVDIHPVRSTTVGEELDKHFDVKNYPVELRPMMQRLFDKVKQAAKQVKIHFVTNRDMVKAVGGDSLGAYIRDDDHILINDEYGRYDAVFHEAFHAATERAIQEDKEFRESLKDFHIEVLKQLQGTNLGREVSYAVGDSAELLTGAMTNRAVQEALKKLKISRELADKLEIPKWRKATMWEGMLSMIRRALGMGPRDTSAIEAAMALSEYAIHKELPIEGAKFAARYAMADARERMQAPGIRLLNPATRQEDEEQAGGRYAGMGQQAGRMALDAMAEGKARATKLAPRFMNGVQLSRWFGKLFTDEKGNIIDRVLEVGRRKGVEMNQRRTDDLDTVAQARVNAQKYKDEQQDYGKLLDASTKFQIDASKPAPTFKGKKAPEDRGLENWQANAKWAEAHEAFNRMPEALQKQYKDEMKFYRDKMKSMAETHIDAVLDNYPLPAGVTRADMRDRMMKGTMQPAEEDHYGNLKALSELRSARKLVKGDTVYFPAYRDGDYVVTGRYSMPDGGYDTDIGGKALPDNIREFDTRKEAHDFAVGTHMHADADKVSYARDTGEKLTTALDREKAVDPARGGASNLATRYEVVLQREHTEMHSSMAEAERARDDMRENGVKELSGVLDKRREGDWGRINTEFGAAMERRIKDRDDLNADQKRATIEAARNYALVRRSALQGRLVYRRHIAGADYGHAESVRSYSEAANRYMVNAKYAPDLDAAMERLENRDNANRDSSDAYRSSAVANEIRERAYRNPEALALQHSPIIHWLMKASYMHWLLGPRHLLMMQSHPYVYSAPEMAGRHGAAAYGALHTAAKDLGGDLSGMSREVSGTAKLIRSWATRDPVERERLARPGDMTAEMLARLKGDEREDMQKLVDTGELHSGFDNEFYGASGMGKVDALIRQMTSAQDAQNRAVVGLSAYRLELAKIGSREKALDYSRRVIQDTVGMHSPMDMASALKHPLARSFMQFKHFPLRQTELMLRNVYNAFRHDDPEVRREAWRAAAHQITSSFSMAGVHGLPVGALKALGLVGYMMGVTPSPAQMDDRARRTLAGYFGATGANVMMDGLLAAIPHAPNLNNMFSRDIDMMFGEPHVTKAGPDWQNYAMGILGGAPASTVFDTLKGLSMLSTDWKQALGYLPAPRVLGDIAKAYNLHEKGLVTASGKQLTPASDADAAWRMLGFGTQQAQRIQSGRVAAEEDIKERPQTKGEQLKAAQKAKREKDIMGIPVTKQNRAMLQERQEVYQ